MVTKEHQEVCLVRVPPGDNWKITDRLNAEVFPSFISAVEHVFQETGCKEYRFSAAEGKVYLIKTEEVEPPKPQSFSIYGED